MFSQSACSLHMYKYELLLFVVISSYHSLCPLSAGEPDSPVLTADEMKVERNSFSVPVKQSDDGGSPLQHYNIRYRQVGASVSRPVHVNDSSLVFSVV